MMCQLRLPGCTQVRAELDWGPGVRVSTSSSWLPGTMKVRRNPSFFYGNYSWRWIKLKLPNLRCSQLSWSIGWLVQDADQSRLKGGQKPTGQHSHAMGKYTEAAVFEDSIKMDLKGWWLSEWRRAKQGVRVCTDCSVPRSRVTLATNFWEYLGGRF